ncbi:hypothetical protein KCU73_g8939, partial [Aureobasidium melanogenum]
LASVQEYFYEQLTTPTSAVRDERGKVDETYEEECLPWPHTDYELWNAFHDDVGCEILSLEDSYDDIRPETWSAAKRQAILTLYHADYSDPEPFLVYCDHVAEIGQISPQDLKKAESLVKNIVEECRDAELILRDSKDDSDADWLAAFASHQWLTDYPFNLLPSRNDWNLPEPDDDEPWQGIPEDELTEGQMGDKLLWRVENGRLG